MTEPVDLNAMTRNDLNTYASEHGVEHPETYATKGELITAIEEAETAPDQPTEEQPTDQPPAEDAPPAEGETKNEATPEPADYAPITPDDDEENPVFVEVPKTDEEVAEEGTALADAESAQTGGAVPFLSDEPAKNKRIWSLDAAHNTNDRAGGRGAEHPDLVETAQ